MNASERETHDPSVLIIGGGIGGLAAAIGLQGAGFDVEIYEQAHELKEVGAGILIWRNGLEALDFLGVKDAVVRSGTIIHRNEFRKPDGDMLRELHLPSHISPDSELPPLLSLHRAELQNALIEHLEEDVVHLNHKCVSVDEQGGRVTARFTSGDEVSGDLLIGADGIHSVVRSDLHGAEEPRFTGIGIWRGLTSVDQLSLRRDTFVQSLGGPQRFFATSIGDGRVYWGATKRMGHSSDGSTPDPPRERLSEAFSEWHDPIPELVQATTPNSLLWDAATDREPLQAWGRGHITLLGDAAHLAAPFMGQGASQALEDAVWLTHYLDDRRKLPTALRAYESHRKDRTDMIVKASRRSGRMLHLSNPIAAAARNAFLKYVPARLASLTLRRAATSAI